MVVTNPGTSRSNAHSLDKPTPCCSPEIIGTSRAIRALIEQVHRVASTNASVLLLGETGTGKDVAARAVHAHSARRDGPFVPVNCAAIPETLLEAELFGHVRGAFTGADVAREGLLRAATGGTAFLDEIADMPLPLQAKLLRVLQDKMIRPVGGLSEIEGEFRIISATNRDLTTAVGDRRFREDLYYRLAVVSIYIPSLRERPDDIPLLAPHFLRRACSATHRALDGFTDEALARLVAHRWPGNVRELENVVHRAVALAAGPSVTARDIVFDALIRRNRVRPPLADFVEDYIEQVLRDCGGDKRRAADVLGISVRTLQRRAARHATRDGYEQPENPDAAAARTDYFNSRGTHHDRQEGGIP